MNTLDTEQDIRKAAEKLAKDNGFSKIHALSMLHSKYQSEKRLEEAVIVKRLIHREKLKAKTENYTKYHDDT